MSASAFAPAAAGDRTVGGRSSGEVRTLARGGTLALAGVVVSAALQFLLVLVVTRGLGAAGAGVFLEAVALFTIAAAVAEFGANTGLVRSLPRMRVLGRSAELGRTVAVAIAPVLGLSVAAAAATFVLAPQLAALLFHGADEGSAVATVRIFAAALPLAAPTIVILSGTRGLGSLLPYGRDQQQIQGRVQDQRGERVRQIEPAPAARQQTRGSTTRRRSKSRRHERTDKTTT